MASSWLTAVALIVIIAVFTFGWSVNVYVGLSVTYFMHLMNLQFVEKLVSDTVCQIAYYICTDILVVWVQVFFLIVCPGVYAQLPPRANAGVAQNTDAVPVAPAALAAPAASAAPSASADPAEVFLARIGRQYMAPGPVHPAGIIEEIEVIPFPFSPGVPAMAAPAVQANNTQTPRERLAALMQEAALLEARNGH